MVLIASSYAAPEADKKDNANSNKPVVTLKATTSSTITLSPLSKNVETVTVTQNKECNASTTGTSTTPKKETLCVKCYDKIINTKDCKKCATICDDGTKIESVDTSNNQCPNKPSKEVPCSCKDTDGKLVEDNFYKTSKLPINNAGLVEEAGKLSN